jgi:hypothetical protein
MAKGLGERDNPKGTRCNGAAGPAAGVTMMATPTTRWMKLTRRLGRDGNPLRRRSDLMEAWLLPASIAAFLALCPVVAMVTGAWVHADNAAARHAQLSWHRVEAVLLQSAAGPMMSDNGANTWVVWTPAKWTADGRRYVGDVPAAAKSRSGSTIAVWLDREGKVRTPPLTAAQLGSRVVTATSFALAILAVLLAGLAWLLRRALDKRRLAGWELAWLAIGPRWTHQA